MINRLILIISLLIRNKMNSQKERNRMKIKKCKLKAIRIIHKNNSLINNKSKVKRFKNYQKIIRLNNR